MATFLVRLPDNEMEALRQRSEELHRSMNDIVRDGIRAQVAGQTREERVRQIARRVIATDADLLKLLADQ